MSRGVVLLLSVFGAAGCAGAEPSAPARQEFRGDKAQARTAPAPQVNGGVAGGIAAQIENEILTWKDVETRLKIPAKETTPELRKAKLREMAEERLFLQAARKNQITVTDQDIEEAIRREMKPFESEEAYNDSLRLRGLTRTENRENHRRKILVTKLYYHLIRKAWMNPDSNTPGLMHDFVTPEEIRRYYQEHPEQFKAVEFVTVTRIALQYRNDREKASQRARAESVVRQLEEGASFLILAHLYSTWHTTYKGRRDYRSQMTRDEASKFFTPETTALLFDKLKVGEKSGIVEDGKSYNVFLIEEHFVQREDPFESEAQDRIRGYLESIKREANRKELVRFLINRAYIWPHDLFDTE